MNAELLTIWIRTASEPEAPYMIDAWDEFTVDVNPAGWKEAVRKADGQAADDTGAEVRIVRVRIDYDRVVKAFDAPVISGEVAS